MNTLELLQHLDFKPEQLRGMRFDKYNPVEFTVSVFKEAGAERYHLYGDKDNFVVLLEQSGRDKHTFLSACPISEVLPSLINYLSQNDGFSREVEALKEFKSNLEAGKLSALGEPEDYSKEVKEFLGSATSRTLNEEEVTDAINRFRTKSGYEPSFDFNKGAIVEKIGEMRNSAFAIQKDKTASLDV